MNALTIGPIPPEYHGSRWPCMRCERAVSTVAVDAPGFHIFACQWCADRYKEDAARGNLPEPSVDYQLEQARARVAELEAVLREIADGERHGVLSWAIDRARAAIGTPAKPEGET